MHQHTTGASVARTAAASRVGSRRYQLGGTLLRLHRSYDKRFHTTTTLGYCHGPAQGCALGLVCRWMSTDPRGVAPPTAASYPSSSPVPCAASTASSDSVVAMPTLSGSGAVAQQAKLRTARLSPRSISHVKQKPVFPGMLRHVSMFEGEHVYNYGRHTFTIMRDSIAMGIVPAGCILGYLVTHMPSWPVIPFEVQCVFMVSLLVLSRFTAAGRRNRCAKDLTGRHVLLTGGTSGIGKATAAQLAAMGADITILAKDSAQAKSALAYVISHAKDTATQKIRFETLNLDDFIAVREYCKRARKNHRPIDILVNAAGVLQEKQVTTRFGDDAQLAINFLGPYLLTEGLLPLVEEAHGRIVYVSCAAHVAVRGNVVSTYLSGRGVWSPRVANQFDGLEQYGFTKLGNIFHAQQLALRSYPQPQKNSVSWRLTRPQPLRETAGGSNKPISCTSGYAAAATGSTETVNVEPQFTCCACSPGGVVTNLYRNIPLAATFTWFYYLYILIMRTAWEGSQTVVNCCVRDDFKNGGYYMNTRYQPGGLSKAACDVTEREQVMNWTYNKMKPYMNWSNYVISTTAHKMGLTPDQTQRVKTAFLSYAQGQPKVSEAMIDQLVCGAIPGLSWEQLQAKKSVRKAAADGYNLGDFFAIINSDPAYITFIEQHFPPAPPEEKEPEVDALALKTAKGF